MQFTDAFTRQRAKQATDPYNPDETVDDWSNPDEIPLEGYFETDSSTEQIDPARGQVVTLRTLVLDDPGADVRRGDRIKQGEKTWTVEGFPDAPRNPFTGWQPGLFIRIRESVG